MILWRGPYVSLAVWSHVPDVPYPRLVWIGDRPSYKYACGNCKIDYKIFYVPSLVYGVNGRSNGVTSPIPVLPLAAKCKVQYH